MAILHLVNKSPFTHDALRSCLAVCSPTDSVLLLEDGVFGTMASAPTCEQSNRLANLGTKFFALSQDVEARALATKISSLFHLIDYDGFVALTVDNHCVQSWY